MHRIFQDLRCCIFIKPNSAFLGRCPGGTQHRPITTTRISSFSVRTTNLQASNAEHSSDRISALPEPEDDSKAMEIAVGDQQGVKLDFLGPMVVNRDGTLSRISNWAQMTHKEQQNTLKVLGKRNQLRVEALQAANDTKPHMM